MDDQQNLTLFYPNFYNFAVLLLTFLLPALAIAVCGKYKRKNFNTLTLNYFTNERSENHYRQRKIDCTG